DMEEEVAQGRFRKDLFFRLSVVGLHIPPLRERPGDLPILVRECLARMGSRLGRPINEYATEAWACLLRYDWPGNVRELENAIEEACQVAVGSEIQLEDLPDAVRRGSAPRPPPAVRPSPDRRSLADVEQLQIDAVLERHRGHRRRTAEELGISLSTLKRKLRRRWRSPSSDDHGE